MWDVVEKVDPVCIDYSGQREVAICLYMGMGTIIAADNNYQYQSDFWKYDPVSDSWRKLSDFPKINHMIMGAFESKGKGYLVSCEAIGYISSMITFSYDPAEDLWKRKADFPGGVLGESLFATVRDRLFIFGGSYFNESDSFFSRALWEYQPDTNTWFKKADFPGTGRWSPRGFVIGDRFYVGYGEDISLTGSWELVDDLWEYDIDKDTWEGRSSFTAKPYFVSLSFGVDGAGYMGSEALGLWKYMPEKDK